ncbi:carotenoid oxygenase [Patellaria atrata CBS 101060]|uniref:Carotenoid oxygenase n=1 Tax=Patellaria atrata CBS 101060 TaxID=1346257 RepID=A0A9P4SAJ5_9PEZI|nr:carotenoid oxygenase [Patellaria atrata CBS 101060]
MPSWKRKRGKQNQHPYLSGNFAPIQRIRPLTSCTYSGTIPDELAGGQYVRNGGNPVTNQDLGRDAHWFDGDGMLSGVLFERSDIIRPAFVNQYILTDIYLSTVSTPSLKIPILPSIATLVNPISSLLHILFTILRTVFLAILSHLPGSPHPIERISVANTGILYHNGRALATCESGPPMRVQLPKLETIGWFDGNVAEGELNSKEGPGFGGEGLLSFMKEWTTGHPKVDPLTGEMILFHSTFTTPYVHYSVIPSTRSRWDKLLNAPVSGVSGAKMMHDFGVSLNHTIIMDLPLTLDPINLLRNKPIVSYDPSHPSRFGIFPRRDPSHVQWFKTSACCIFHTVNTWDVFDASGDVDSVNLLACRQTSASVVFAAGNLTAPKTTMTIESSNPISFFDTYDEDEALIADDVSECSSLLDEAEQCRLYYYSFSLRTSTITSQYALSAISFEFPSCRPDREMQSARYVYGCSTSTGSSFSAALGKAAKIDVIAKVDVETLIRQGLKHPPATVTGCVDRRSIAQVLASEDPKDPIRCFKLPPKHFAQESRFVPRKGGGAEDDGFLLFYIFDESQLTKDGNAPETAFSELWVLDARNMRDVVCKVKLPQRVPYGLHGSWFSEEMIRNQRPIGKLRSLDDIMKVEIRGGAGWRAWMAVRKGIERLLR